MLRDGKSEREIIDYMTARYGDFVLYRPPVKGATALLWFGPVVFLAGGLTILVLVLRRRSRLAAEQFEPDLPDAADAPEPVADPVAAEHTRADSPGHAASPARPAR
jgi:cytochrome c-type biogenesis protein CcmH